ncbi:MAG TPA: hypothetical protein VH207_05525 [Chthoniobacterales bacterium]|jgi:hypothetical protein|nr:hypothetical protein [Chthoniobacterales bacterium]
MKTAATILLVCLTIVISQPAAAESLWEKILRITGITATPSQQKAPGEEMASGGMIWIGDPATGTRRRVRDDGEFRSPIFAPDDSTILALRNGWLWRMDAETGKGDKAHHLSTVTKLIGKDRDDPDKILVLREENGKEAPAFLSLKSGSLTDIPYDAQSAQDRNLLNHLRGWERDYGKVSVYPKAQRRESVVGPVEWQDVFFKKGDAEPINVSRSDGDSCGQPSLSSDGSKVAYIRVTP